MTYLEIYNRVILNIYGNTAPAANVINYLQGTAGSGVGIIEECRKRLMNQRNFYFMQKRLTFQPHVPLVRIQKTLTLSYAHYVEFVVSNTLPAAFTSATSLYSPVGEYVSVYETGYSEIDSRAFKVLETQFSGGDRIVVVDTTPYYDEIDSLIAGGPLSPVDAYFYMQSYPVENLTSSLKREVTVRWWGTDGVHVNMDKYATGQEDFVWLDDSSKTGTKPLYYGIERGHFRIYPIPKEPGTIELFLYEYLAMPATPFVGDVTDVISEECAEILIVMATKELAAITDRIDKLQLFQQKELDFFDSMSKQDSERKNNVSTMAYCDL